MTIHPWEAFLAGALVASDAAAPAKAPVPRALPGDFDYSWERDVPILLDLCRAAGRDDQAAIAAGLSDQDPRVLLTAAVGVLVGLATVEVARGEADDVETVFATWAEMASG